MKNFHNRFILTKNLAAGDHLEGGALQVVSCRQEVVNILAQFHSLVKFINNFSSYSQKKIF